MIEIIFVALSMAAVARLARRRGGKGWIWAVGLALSYLVVVTLGAIVIGSGPALIVGLLWIGIYFAIVLLAAGGGRTASDTWQCPECQFFNEPTTLVCPCGYRVKAGAGA